MFPLTHGWKSISIIKAVQEFRRSDFIKSVSILMTGSAISQVIPIIASPIISRLYMPSDYAIIAAYSSITVLLTIVSTGMYSSALMIDSTNEQAFATGIVAITITVIVTFLSMFIVLIFRDEITAFSGNTSLSFWLYFIPLTVFFSGSYQTLSMWHSRKTRYKNLATNRVIQSLVISSSSIIIGSLGYHSMGLLLSSLIGQAFSFCLLLVLLLRFDLHHIRSVNFKMTLQSLVHHKNFPIYNMPQGFLDGIRESSIMIIFSNYFGQTVLGSYSFAMSILNKPVQFMGNSFNQVFFQKASEKYRQGSEIWSLASRTIKTLLVLALPIICFFVFFGEDIFTFVFGKNWSEAGRLAQILAIWLLFRFILSAIASIPQIVGKMRKDLFVSTIYNIFPPLVLYITVLIQVSIYYSIMFFVVANLIVIFYAFSWYYKISYQGDKK